MFGIIKKVAIKMFIFHHLRENELKEILITFTLNTYN